MKRLKTLYGYLPIPWASTSNVSSRLTERPDDIKQINDSVWEFFKPPPGNDRVPRMEILFFHGAQLSRDPEAFWTTWLSRDETVVWPTAWLAEKFPGARILFVSYDSAVRKSSGSQGEKDTYQTIENLMQDIVWSSTCKAGQKCPVIFVGHCFGGIIIKDFLIKCAEYSATKDLKDRRVTEIRVFLEHCKAIFYYSTPNGGCRLMDGVAYKDYILGNVNQSVVDFLEILSQHTARINNKFSDLRRNRQHKWETRGIGETLETNLTGSKKTMVVPQASARQDLDQIYWAYDADHFGVSKARNNSSCSIFVKLYDLVFDYHHARSRSIHPLPFGQDNKYVPIVESVEEVREALEGEHESHIITICGEPGSGKTSLVKYLALQYQPHHPPQGPEEASSSMVFPDGVFFLLCGQGAERKVKQLQNYLLQSLGCESEAVPMDIPEERDGDYVTIPTFRRRLQFRLKDLKALIILDDIWERRVLEELILSHDEAASVRYLITTQFEDIWEDAERVRMRRPRLEEARQILLKYTKGLASMTDFPESIKVTADSIIKDLDFHPLTLANVGLGFEQHEGEDPEAWETIKDLWHNKLPVKDAYVYTPSIFGRGYLLAVDETMIRIMQLLNQPARDLLFLMCVLKDSHLPQPAVKYLYKCANNGNMSGWRGALSHLRNSSLVDVYSYNFGAQLIIHKLRAFSIRLRFPNEVQALLQRALQPTKEMCNNHIAQLTLVGTSNFKPVLQSVREIYNHHSAHMILNATRGSGHADGNSGLLNASMVGMYMNNIFLEDVRMQIPRGVAFAVDNILTTVGEKERSLTSMVKLLHLDHGGEIWKQKAARCAEKIIVRFACQHEVDEESVICLMELPEACNGVLFFLAMIFEHGYWWTQFSHHNQTFLDACPQIASKLFALVHNNTTSVTMLADLVQVFLGLHVFANGLLDYENDDTIVDIGERLIKLALRENAHISLECVPLHTFPLSESRAFRVIEKKIPDLWKAMLRTFIQKYTSCNWFSRKEKYAPHEPREDKGVLELLCERVYYDFYYVSKGLPRESALRIWKWLSSGIKTREDLSVTPDITTDVIAMLIHILEENECDKDDVCKAAEVLWNLALSQEIRQKILSTYPSVANTLLRLEKQYVQEYPRHEYKHISLSMGVLHSNAEAVHIQIADYSPLIPKLQLQVIMFWRIFGYFTKKNHEEFLATMEDDLLPRDVKSESYVMTQIIAAKVMLKRYQSALADADALVSEREEQRWSTKWTALALALRGAVRLLSGEDLPEALIDFEKGVHLWRMSVAESIPGWRYDTNDYHMMMYYMLKQRGFTKHLMGDDAGARQDALEAQQLQLRNLVWDRVFLGGADLSWLDIEALLFGQPRMYLGFNFTFRFCLRSFMAP